MRRVTSVLLALSALTLVACSEPENAVRLLGDQGYTEIETQGYSWFGCSEDDTFRTEFTATSPAGSQVSGVVCRGWFKGATVRFN